MRSIVDSNVENEGQKSLNVDANPNKTKVLPLLPPTKREKKLIRYKNLNYQHKISNHNRNMNTMKEENAEDI